MNSMEEKEQQLMRSVFGQKEDFYGAISGKIDATEARHKRWKDEEKRRKKERQLTI